MGDAVIPGMCRDDGHTLVEVLVALLVMSLLLTSVVLIATRAQQIGRDVPQWIDQQQRARAALDLMTRDIRQSGAGLDIGPLAGPLPDALPGVWPARLSATGFTVSASAVTTVTVSGAGMQASLSSPVPPGSATWSITRSIWCGTRSACGARVGDDVMVWMMDGRFDLATVERVAADAITVRRVVSSGGAFPIGAPVATVLVRVYAFDPARAQLRLADAGGTEQPVIDGVREFTVTQEVAVGATTMPAASGAWLDGPWRGSGATMHDADLRRIRLVRLRLVLDATDVRVGPLSVATDVAVRNTCLSC